MLLPVDDNASVGLNDTNSGGDSVEAANSASDNQLRLGQEQIKRYWINLPNETNNQYSGIKTSFRLEDYITYGSRDNDREYSAPDPGSQNQMLPIYCSLMGLIILSLVIYVIYKLWKQRGSMSKIKMHEHDVSDLVGIKVVKRSSQRLNGGSNGELSQHSTLLPSPHAQDSSNRSAQLEATQNHRDREPLLYSRPTNKSDLLNQPLSSLPVETLGLVCYKLSQHPWKETVAHLNIDSDRINYDQPPSPPTSAKCPSFDALMNAATLNQVANESPAQLCHVVRAIYEAVVSSTSPNRNQPISIGQFVTALNATNLMHLSTYLGVVDLESIH